MMRLHRSYGVVAFVLMLAWWSIDAHAQGRGAAPAQETPPTQAQEKPLADALGRDTPQGTVRGFLAAARRGEAVVASQYLDGQVPGMSAEVLTQHLFVVLDARLPARLTEISEAPEGSRSNPLRPNEELVGVIGSAAGDIPVVLERVTRGNSEPIWLFSQSTLASVPELYEEVRRGWVSMVLPRFLTSTRILGIRLFEWIVVLLGMPLVYLLTVALNKILRPLIRLLWRRITGRPLVLDRDALPTPVRLLILAVAIRWALAALPLTLLVRQFWSNLASLFIIVGIVWLLMLLTGEVERYIGRRLPRSNVSAASALVRLLRRTVDLLLIFAGLLATLRHFGIDATPALAGLGVGGIAVALAAQKTLENVIAGASLIFDQAVRVGDALKMGEVQGTVEHIGLRSTRIRTLDRTMVSVPNSQIANVSLETLSARDKFWFHPVIGVSYETLPEQLRAVVDGIRRLLDEHPSVERNSVRVRFLRLGTFSLDIDVFAYVFASDWGHFLEIQEQLLFSVTSVVEAAGTQIALPSQMTYHVTDQKAPALPRSQTP
jgi:MscS family membrane protein